VVERDVVDDLADRQNRHDRGTEDEAGPVLARFGRFAVRCPDIARCVERAVDLVASELRAGTVALLEVLGPGRVAVVHGLGPAGLTPDVWRPDSVDIAPPGLSVQVPVAGVPWGRIIVADGARGPFSDDEVALVEGVAGILSAALERERVEGTRASVAELGRYALRSRDIALTVQRVVDVAARVLEAPVIAVLRPGVVDTDGAPDADDGLVPGPRTFTVLQAWGPIGLDRGEHFDLDPDLAACPADRSWVVDDRPDDVRLPGRAALVVPVLVDGREWGRLVVADLRPRRFAARELETAGALVDVLAAAVERDAEEGRLRRVTDDVRRSLVPAVDPVPLPAGLEVARRAGHDAGWCDVLPLSQGGVALVTGRVAGDDVVAETVAARVRDLTRVFAAEGHSPAVVTARVDRFVSRHAGRPVVWCYAELQPAGPTLTWTAAGCPGPQVLDAAGDVLTTSGPVRPPLGPGPGPEPGPEPDTVHREITVLLPSGATVLLAADPGGAGLVRATATSATSAAAAATAATAAVGGLLDAATADPFLAVRLAGADPGGCVRRVFRPEPASIPAARRFVRDVLVGWHLEGWQRTAALAVSELVTNTLLHTASAIDLTVRRTEGDGVWIGVYDDSDRSVRPVLAPAGHDDVAGRGLVVVSVLADTWGVTPAASGPGKTVWLELTPARGPFLDLDDVPALDLADPPEVVAVRG